MHSERARGWRSHKHAPATRKSWLKAGVEETMSRASWSQTEREKSFVWIGECSWRRRARATKLLAAYHESLSNSAS